MGNVARLSEAEFLDRVRRSAIARWTPAPIGLRAAALLKGGAFLLLGLVLYAPPLSRAGALGPLPGPLARPALVMNLASVFFAYFGLFAGAWLSGDQVLGPNERLLAFPISLRDLARFRLWEAVKSALKTALFVVLPVVSLAYLGAGWHAGAVVLVLATGLLLLLGSFLTGMVLMLHVLRPLRRVSPESVFITMFLGSTWLFVAALSLHRWEATAGLDAFVRRALGELGRFALPALLDRIAAAPVSFAAVMLVFCASLVPVVITLLVAVDRALVAAYVTAHRRGGDAATEVRAAAAERPPIIGYGRVVEALRFLPVTPRALLARDVLSVVRRPFLALRLLGLALPLLLLPSLGRQSVRDPAALAIYLFSAFFCLRLFLEAGSEDMESRLSVRQGFSTGWSYLRARLLIVFVATASLLAPVFVAAAVLAGWGNVGIGRGVFVLANVLLASALVVPFSALLAGFRRDDGSGPRRETHPSALLLLWSLGAAGPFCFYRLDLALHGAGVLGAGGALAGALAVGAVAALNLAAATTCLRRA